MTAPELFAYYKRTAPFYDLQFFLQHATTLSPDVRARLDALATRVDASGRVQGGRAAFHSEYVKAQDAWRRGNLAAEYAAKRAAAKLAKAAKRATKKKKGSKAA